MRSSVDPGSGGSGVPLGGAGGAGGAGGSLISMGGASGAACASDCGAGASTRISGVVRDPAGRVPLYNVRVFVPGAALPALDEGASCDRCVEWAGAAPMAVSITDVEGRFLIEGAPAGTNVPVVIQIGKWRREVVVPEVRACEETVISDGELTRLPRRQAEGHLPRIAVAVGADDSIECFLRRVGIADDEFSTSDGNGRVHLFAGCDAGFGTGRTLFAGGEAFTPASELWNDWQKILPYDALMLGCAGGECAQEQELNVGNLFAYTNQGGKVFLDHHQRGWVMELPSWETAVGILESPLLAPAVEVSVNTGFPKGSALAEWLLATGASSTHGKLTIQDAELWVQNAFVGAQPWLFGATADMMTVVPALTLDVPSDFERVDQCGRVTVTDFHVSNELSPDAMTATFPDGCVDAPLSSQELALEYLLFDQAGCVADGVPPTVKCGP